MHFIQKFTLTYMFTVKPANNIGPAAYIIDLYVDSDVTNSV